MLKQTPCVTQLYMIYLYAGNYYKLLKDLTISTTRLLVYERSIRQNGIAFCGTTINLILGKQLVKLLKFHINMRYEFHDKCFFPLVSVHVIATKIQSGV